ncbi:hypothetical protein [Alkalihalobacterium chitinilyticum]|uniref:Uncharacterized protein n=1 Tax=Alkalihalobacterium chitinilyticum TaxID=2980103 RepID=A0ABT5VDC6_9BACI|nr:hypothetical protein [Alkalihalobacterium chitinilyticum]MDE5413439.1 hypothetical protein [Alkalihalobacterium chitinilyticum]
MDLKYRENSVWKTTGVLWLGVAVLNLICLVFLFIGLGFSAYTVIVAIIISCNVALSIIIGIYYLRLNDITYIQLENDMLLVHKGLIRLKRKINYNDIEESRISDNKLILLLTNGKEVEINLDLLKIRDFDKLNIKLSEHVEIRQAN